jgi:ATP-binding cassette, subfamily B, multidrug efflux pump
VRKDLALLIPYVKRYRSDLLQGVLALVIASLFAAAIPFLIKLAVDGLQEGLSRKVMTIIAVSALLALCQAALRYRSRIKILNSSREIEFELRRDFYAHLISLPYAFFREHHRGDLIARMMNDIGNVRMMVSMGILHFSATITTTILSLIMMFKLSPSITLLAVFPLCFLFLIVRRFMKKLHRIFMEIQNAYGTLSRGVTEVLSGVRVVKNYVLQEEEQKRFDGLNSDYMGKSLAATRVWALVFPSIGLLGGFGTLLVMWVGGYYLMQDRITLGDFIALNTYYMMLMWPIAALGWILNLYQRGVASLRRIETVYESAPESEEGVVPEAVKGLVAFDRVTVTKAERPVLDRVSFALEPGEKLLVIGPTGGGKSTLLNVLLGLEQDYEGTVSLDGGDIRQIALPARRRYLGLVPQDPFLYSLSIRENVFNSTDIEALIRMVQMKDEVERFDRDLDTVVGQRGVTLSGGQKQRLTLARALSVKPRVLLLDDPFAHVDGYTEYAIWEAMWPALEETTVVIASSKPVPLQRINRVMVLVNGSVADYGSPDQVLARDPYMKLLYETRSTYG